MADEHDVFPAAIVTASRPPPAASGTRALVAWRDGVLRDETREVAAEAAVAMTYNRTTHAVMMATPADLADLAIGFSLAERIVDDPGQIEDCEIILAGSAAVECRMWIRPDRMDRLDRRRRRLAGVTGCGMCGLESLDEALLPPARVAQGAVVSAADVARAVASLRPAQLLNASTRAVHAAGFWTGAEGLVAIREDVGRHNALDKLGGTLASAGRRAVEGIVLLTSRLSVELVQKAALMGAPLVAAVSAPTTLAIEMAEQAGITLVGVAREDGFEVFTRPDRIV